MKCHKMREYKKKYSVSGYFPTHCGNFVWYAKNLPNIFAVASFEFSTMVCIKFPAKKIIKPIPTISTIIQPNEIISHFSTGYQRNTNKGLRFKYHNGWSYIFFCWSSRVIWALLPNWPPYIQYSNKWEEKEKNLSMGRTSITSLSPRKLITDFQWKFIIPSELYAGPSAYFVQIARNPMFKFC